MTLHEPQHGPTVPLWPTDPLEALLALGAPGGSLDVPTSEMSDLVAATDWASGPLGDPAAWPQSLRTAVDICLASRFPILLWWGPDLVMVYNDAYRPMLGRKHPRALGSPGAEVWTEIWSVIGPMLEHVMAGGGATWSTDQRLVLDRNGYPEESYFTFSYSPVHDESGGVAGVFSAVSETTERVLGERRLATLAEMAGLMGATDRREVVRTAAAILGANAADHPAVLVVEPPDDPDRLALAAAVEDRLPHLAAGTRARLADLVRQVSGTGRAAHFPADRDAVEAGVRAWHAYPVARLTATQRQRSAAVIVLGESLTRPWDSPLEAYATLCTTHVATALADLDRLADERRQREVLLALDEAKSAFFTNLSHELRTPLTLIGAPLAEAIRHEVDPGQRRRLELVERSAHRLTRLVDAMLDFGRMEAGAIEPAPAAVDLTDVTRGLAESFRPAAERVGLRFEVDCADGIRTVLDRDMFERVVLNLLTNAVKYTPEGSVGLTLRTDDDGVEVAVRDSGIGIAADDVDRAFERFGRLPSRPGARSHEGAGLGLAMVKQLTELMGGSVTVCSELDRGSTFTVRLPTARPGSEPGARDTGLSGLTPRRVDDVLREVDAWVGSEGVEGPAPLAGREPVVPDEARRPRVLIAEDNGDLRSYLGDVLADLYDVELVADGAAALRSVVRDTPDLVVADVMMPGLDGYGLVEAIRRLPASSGVPVVLLSARAGDGETSTGLAAGADDYLVKPFSVVELRARVASNLERAVARTRDASWRRAVMDGFHDALLILDLDGTVLEVNDRFTALLGWAADERPFTPPYPWDLPEADRHSTFADAVDLARTWHDGPDSVEAVLAHRDGTRVVGSVRVSVVDGGRREPSLLLATVRDVTTEHDERARRAAAARLAAELGAADELTEVVAAAVAGLGVLFEGAATVRVVVGTQQHVFTASGPLGTDDLDGRVAEALDAEPCEPPEHGHVDGILLAAGASAPQCRVWVSFDAPRVVSADERIAGDLLVQALALAVDRVVAATTFTQREQHLRRAIESHEEIGQAVGILVERHRWTPTVAFDRLKKASQDHNVRLREVATRIIDSGIDPDDVGSRGR